MDRFDYINDFINHGIVSGGNAYSMEPEQRGWGFSAAAEYEAELERCASRAFARDSLSAEMDDIIASLLS